MQKNETPTAAPGDIQPPFAARLTSMVSRFADPVLVFLILLGLACRFYGLNWDEGTTLHPDERFCVSLVPGLHFPANIQQFFDSRVSPVNPANLPGAPHYVYGQIPLFIGAIAAHLTGRVEGAQFLLVGRVLSGLFDCGTVLFTFLIARRLLGKRSALLAAALIAGAALHIQQSHFFVVDPFAAFFLAAAFWAGTCLVQRGRLSDALLCGAFFGAAVACKISAVLFGVAMLGFLVLFAKASGFRKTLICGLGCLLMALLVFRVGHPMAFRGEFGFFDVRPEARFVKDVTEQAGITKGIVDVPFDVQWVGRTPWLFSLRNLGFWGYGWPFLLSAIAGFALLFAKRKGQAILIVGALFALILLMIQGAAFSKFSRYYLPLTPFCALLAAYFWREMSLRKPAWKWGAVVTVGSVVCWGLSVTSIYSRLNTRIAASLWIADNVEPAGVVANETAWDEGLPISWYNKMPPTNFKTIVLDSYDYDTEAKRVALVQKLDQADWIFLSSGRSWQNIPRWPEKWPMMTAFYRSLFDGKLGFRLEKSFTSFPTFGPLQFPDASAEEALTVYDHPVVLLFRKTPEYDGENVRGILESVELPAGQPWEPRKAPQPDESKLPLPPGF